VTSEVGKGSVFSLLLPVGRSQSVSARTQSAPVRPSQVWRPRVLLVEDDAGVRDATRMLLSVEGFRVSAVATLSEALRCAREEGAPDLLITDYHLRDGELGTEVIAALCENLRTKVKAVLVTGDTSRVVKAMPNDPHLRIASKPINAEELLAVLKGLLAA
jgi:CheY-like chemotaxis protein